jgi:hypothetical protein
METKSTDISEDAPNNEGKDEPGACVKQEQIECGPVSLQPESSLVATAATERELSDKQENATDCRQEQEDDSAHHSEGICIF